MHMHFSINIFMILIRNRIVCGQIEILTLLKYIFHILSSYYMANLRIVFNRIYIYIHLSVLTSVTHLVKGARVFP